MERQTSAKFSRPWGQKKKIIVIADPENVADQTINPRPTTEVNVGASCSFEASGGIKTVSEKKINLFKNLELQTFEATKPNVTILPDGDLPTEIKKTGQYGIINFNNLNNLLEPVICPNCLKNSLKCMPGRTLGLAVELQLFCSNCESIINKKMSSPQLFEIETNPTRASYEVNRRAILAVKEVGLGNTGLNKMLGIMDVAGSLHHKTFQGINKTIYNSLVFSTASNLLIDAHKLTRQAYEDIDPELKDNPTINIGVTFDGSWHKRGHTSNYGIGFVIDMLTGLVLDYEILSKYCFECEFMNSTLKPDEKNAWSQIHKQHCDKNYDGSSSSTETEIAKILCARSTNLGFCYSTILSDGDSSVYPALVALEPYGPNNIVKKEECINHVQKRLYSGLDNIAKNSRISGEPILGRGKMSRDRMLKWQSYYRNAIRKNIGNIDKTKAAIWAILFHSVSTPEIPHHHHCSDEWCYYQIAIRDGKTPDRTNHDFSLPLTVAEHFIPLFTRLTDTQLLERCQQNKTQNVNESLHAQVWRKIPKVQSVSRKTFDSGVALAVCEFNKGATALLDTLNDMGINPGHALQALVTKLDNRRLKDAARQSKMINKKARKAKKITKAKKDSSSQAVEGVTYSGGQF